MVAILGLDIGTTGVKGIAFSADGAYLASAYRPYRLIQQRPGWAELDPREVSTAIVEVIHSIVTRTGKSSISAICSSALGEAIVPVDDRLRPVDNSIIAIDNRAEWQAIKFSQLVPPGEFFHMTGQMAHPIASLFKLLWWKQERPEIFARARGFFCWNEMLAVLLGVPPAISPSLAARTGMYDLAAATWSERILEAAELSPDRLAPIVRAGEIVEEIPLGMAADFGLRKGCVLVSGGWDQACAALGAGAIEPGVVVNSMGTTDSLNVTFRGIATTNAMMTNSLACTPHPVEGLFCSNAFSTGGGNLLYWYQGIIGTDVRSGPNAGDLTALIDQAIAASKNPVMVLPHFAGSGTPSMDPQSLGCVLGCTIATVREDLLRGIIEGIALEMWVNLKCLVACGLPVEQIHVCGGGARSRAALELRSAVFGRRIIPLEIEDAGCLACGMLAARALEPAKELGHLVHQWVRAGNPIDPDPGLAAAYNAKRAIFVQLYPALKSIMHDIQRITNT